MMMCGVWSLLIFFKQKTAYELRISDWSSDVCSSDLRVLRRAPDVALVARAGDHDHSSLERIADREPQHRLVAVLEAGVHDVCAVVDRPSDALGDPGARKSVVQGNSVSVRVDLGGR